MAHGQGAAAAASRGFDSDLRRVPPPPPPRSASMEVNPAGQLTLPMAAADAARAAAMTAARAVAAPSAPLPFQPLPSLSLTARHLMLWQTEGRPNHLVTLYETPDGRRTATTMESNWHGTYQSTKLIGHWAHDGDKLTVTARYFDTNVLISAEFHGVPGEYTEWFSTNLATPVMLTDANPWHIKSIRAPFYRKHGSSATVPCLLNVEADTPWFVC